MQDKLEEISHFDEFTSEKPWNAFTDKSYNKIINLFIKKLNPNSNDIIIDMGCGTGELAEKIKSKKFSNVIGLDISKNCILMAKKQYKGIKFRVGDIEKTGFKNNSIDVIFYCGILHHFMNREKVLNEANRILKNNGKLFIFEPHDGNPILWLFRNEKSPLKSNKLKTPNEKFLRKEEIISDLKKSKFKIIDLNCSSGISYTKEHFEKLLPFPFYYAVYLYNLFDLFLDNSPFRNNFGSYIYACAKKSL